MPELQDLTLDISQTIDVHASAVQTFNALIQRLTSENASPDNKPMPMVLEQWPGGRWYRDLGDDHGHLWGFVQVIKPPRLIEIQGPLFMSYAVAGHVQFRVTEESDHCGITLRHQAIGMVDDSHRKGVTTGWDVFLKNAKQLAERES